MTSEEAIALGGTKFWETMTHQDIAKFQWFEPLMCMPFDVFHEALEKTLGRPVWTHELALNREGIERELLGDETARPTMQEIIEMIPADKRVVLTLPNVDPAEPNRV